MRKVLSGLIGLTLIASGCGTFVHGTKQELSISTEPPGATAIIETQSCVTPCTMTVSRKAEKITIKKDGFEQTYELSKHFNAGATIFGNILWLLPGIIIDAISGGAMTIDPVNIKLDEKKQSGILFEKGKTTVFEIENLWGKPVKISQNDNITTYHYIGKVTTKNGMQEIKVVVNKDGKVQDIQF
ncbi:MAG: PEGA domain-containing protein [Thermodesulfovibrio sp.]|jgi:hypothetical protein|uniref:PEGA domain-containing protein n=1 Tax=Thermodesulfovibrio obliviosus TaxID=3118332 RepID=A0AAU8GZ16_9BACT